MQTFRHSFQKVLTETDVFVFFNNPKDSGRVTALCFSDHQLGRIPTPTGESVWVRPVEEVQVDCALPQRRYLQGGGSFFSIGGSAGKWCGQKLAKHFFILQNGSFGTSKGWQSKVFFLKIYKGNCVVWCLYVCFCIIFLACTALRNVKQKNDVLRCRVAFFDLSSIWVYMKRFPLNMGPLGPVGPSLGSDWWGWPFETEVVAPKR